MPMHPLCPFYEKVEFNTLHCEKGDINFPDSIDKDTWLRMHCYTWKFKICRYYCQLMKKYNAD